MHHPGLPQICPHMRRNRSLGSEVASICFRIFGLFPFAKGNRRDWVNTREWSQFPSPTQKMMAFPPSLRRLYLGTDFAHRVYCCSLQKCIARQQACLSILPFGLLQLPFQPAKSSLFQGPVWSQSGGGPRYKDSSQCSFLCILCW